MGRHVPAIVKAINKHSVIILIVNSGYKNESIYDYNFILTVTTVAYGLVSLADSSIRNLGIKYRMIA
jgi:hypothetical protein